jgi:uncharacterized lipoprotein YehR (DUF1307 family)
VSLRQGRKKIQPEFIEGGIPMKKITSIALCLLLIITFASCGNNQKNETKDDNFSTTEDAELWTINGESLIDSDSEENMESDLADTEEEAIHDGVDMDYPPINWGTPDGPEMAAENYYKNTVFELVSLDVQQSSAEYVKFSVVSKKDGEIVEPNRTIELCYEDGEWKVTNEGY